MSFDPGEEAAPAPPLSWRVWLLLPLVLVSLLGVAVPVWGVHFRDRAYGALPPEPRLPRQPYALELLELLENEKLTLRDIRLITGLHDECMAKRNAAGTIPGKLRERVDRLLERYR